MPAIIRPTVTFLAEVGVRDGTSDTGVTGTGEVSAARKFVGLWAEREGLAKYFLGMPQIERDGGTGEILRLRRLPPLPHSDRSTLYAARITVEHGQRPAGVRVIAGDLSVAQKWRTVYFSVHYEQPRYRILSDDDTHRDEEYYRWTEKPKIQVTTDVLSLKAGSGKYKREGGGGADGQIVPYGRNVVQPVNRVSVRWRDLPVDLYRTLDEEDGTPWQHRIFGDPGDAARILLPGTLNSTQLGSSWMPGQLLFVEAAVEPAPCPVDDPDWPSPVRWDVTFNFLHRPTPGGWNSIFYADPVTGAKSGYYYYSRSNTYYAPGDVPDYDSLYNERDHSALWRVHD